MAKKLLITNAINGEFSVCHSQATLPLASMFPSNVLDVLGYAAHRQNELRNVGLANAGKLRVLTLTDKDNSPGVFVLEEVE
jgi:hypothetical protein